MFAVINTPHVLSSISFRSTSMLPAPDPRFVRGPSELCVLATTWGGTLPADGLIVQEKVDGIRALWIDGQLVTREGNAIGGTTHIADVLRRLEHACGQRMMFDGEFQVDGALAPTLKHFVGGGRYGDAGRLHLFDAVPLEEWRQNNCALPLRRRLEALERFSGALQGSPVSVLPWRALRSADALRAAAQTVWERGGEGLVAKVPSSLYRRRRYKAWLKVKQSD